MGKKFTVIVMIALALLLIQGCGKSNARVAKTVQTSLQRNLNTDPQYSNLNLKVSDLTVEKQDRHNYLGTAKLEYANVEHEVPLIITVDGTNITWDFAPGAMRFLEGRY